MFCLVTDFLLLSVAPSLHSCFQGEVRDAPLRVPCLLSRAAQSSGDVVCWLSVPGELGLTGVLVSDRVLSGYSRPARWLRRAGGQRWDGEGHGERGDREGLSSWSLAGTWRA